MADWRARLRTLRSRLHRIAFTVSRGRLLARWGGHPALLLTTTGRISGRSRRTMLVSPVRHGDSLVVVASDGGADRDPQWYRNLSADPDVEVLVAGRRTRRIARTAAADERRALWDEVVASAPAYGRYQEQTSRELPVVVLEPDTSVTSGPPRPRG